MVTVRLIQSMLTMDASQTIDSDGDGFGDNASGTTGTIVPVKQEHQLEICEVV